MTLHTATISWRRSPDQSFTGGRFSRVHEWSFDGGLTVQASSSPLVIPRFSEPAAVDPEEAFVASISSCHMMSFLYFVSRRGLVVNSYRDTAVGELTKNEDGRHWISSVTLRPVVAWDGVGPDAATEEALHQQAHSECYIANSVRTQVRWELSKV